MMEHIIYLFFLIKGLLTFTAMELQGDNRICGFLLDSKLCGSKTSSDTSLKALRH